MRVGQIVGAHGLRGQVKVDPLTDFHSRFEPGARLRIRDEWVEVETYQLHKGRPLLKLRGINDVDAAKKLQWEYLEVLESKPELEEDEFMVEDLLGLRVLTSDGRELGVVDEVLETPAHEVLVVGPVMIPFVDNFVDEVNFDDKTITVSLIPGMLPGE